MVNRVVVAVASALSLAVLAPAPSAHAVGAPSTAPADVQPDGCMITLDRDSAYKASSAARAIEIGNEKLTDAKGDQVLHVVGTTGGGPITAYKVEIELSFKRWTVLESKPGEITENSISWSGAVPVSSFAKYGIGIFLVHVTTESAGKFCFVSAYIKATHANPFLTVAGASASVVALLALYLFAAYFGGFGFIQEVSFSVKNKRRLFKPRLGIGPMLGGVLGGLAVVVLLQQAAVVYPSTRITVAAPAGGLVFSLVYTSTIRKKSSGKGDHHDRELGDDIDLEDQPRRRGKTDSDDVRGTRGSSRDSSKSGRRTTSGRKRGANKSGRRHPAAQRPHPGPYIATPLPPPPPGATRTPGQYGAPAPATTRPAVVPSGPYSTEPSPPPPPPPPYLG